MNETKKITDNRAFALDFALFWAIFGWLALLGTLFDFFHAWIFIAYSILFGGYFFFSLVKKRRVLRFSVDFVVANILILLTVFVFSLFVTPTVFSGRDQGSISNAAINLAQNHQLEFSTPASREFFSIYGKGKALNFPGFYYTESGNLTTQFPLGYISWLASFYSVFGLNGLIIANAACLYLFLLSLYMIGKMLLKMRYALILMVFSITSFSFVWFFKFTLSENLTLALLWTMILSVLYLSKEPDKKVFSLYLLTSSLLVFTRIEGYAFLATSAIFLATHKNLREFAMQNKRALLASAAFFVLALLANFSKTIPFFTEIGKVILNFMPDFQEVSEKGSSSLASSAFRMIQIHTLYGLSLFMLLGSLGILRSLWEKSKTVLIPLFVAFPSLIYIVDSNISSDHPWMLRRFSFAVLPLFIFYTTYFLKFLFERNKQSSRHPIFWKYVARALSIVIVLINLNSFSRFAFYSEDQRLLEQTKELGQKFSPDDLVLVDRLASENGWSMITGPMQTLLGRQAVYLTNPADLEKIDLNKFKNVYLITPQSNLAYYAGNKIGSRLNTYQTYGLKTTRLVESNGDRIFPYIAYPKKEEVEADGYILKYAK